MFDITEKRIVLLGGTGLIGRFLFPVLSELGARVITAGTGSDNDEHFDCASLDDSAMTAFLKQTNPDVLINLAYPKNYVKHLNCFTWVTWRAAEWMKERQEETWGFSEIEHPRKSEDRYPEWLAMKERTEKWQGGAIINFASIYGGVVASDPRRYEGTDMWDGEEWLTYAAVKGGVVSLTRELAVRYAPFNVRINCISPGGVSDDQPYEFVKRYCDAVPMGRMAKPEDLIGPVVFLASEASRYVVGQNLVIDGGLSCW